MGEIRAVPQVTLIVAAFSRYSELLDRLPEQLAAEFGPVALIGPRVNFTETDYYTSSMGADLQKQIFAFENLMAADGLPAVKRRTNELETSLLFQEYPEARPLNLDPGYVDSGKLVLASTKDHAHRVYLSDGIYGEVTLYLRGKEWQIWPWTYPDYRRADVQQFLLQVRQFHRECLKSTPK